MLTEVYRQRDREGAELSMNSTLLYKELEAHMPGRVMLIDDRSSIYSSLQGEETGDEVIVFMGAGDIDDVAREYASTR